MKKSKIQLIVILLIILLGCLFSIISSYPGFMSPDSFNQYEQARSGVYTDWHPPVMAWIWHYLLCMKDGPQPMLILHNILFWSGIFLIAIRLQKFYYSIVLLILCFSPSILNFIGVIWKDTFLFSLLVFISGFTFYFKNIKFSKGKLFLISAIFFILCIIAVMLRHNAAAAILPVIWLFLILNFNFRYKIIYPLSSLVVTILLFLFCQHLNSRLCKGKSQFPQQQLMVYDLLAVSFEKKQNLLPDYLKGRLPMDTINKIYNFYDGGMYAIFNLKCVTENPDELDALRHCWKKQIFENHKIIYNHKYWTFRCLQDESSFTTYSDITPNQYGIQLRPNFIRAKFIQYTESSFAKKFYKASNYLKGCGIIFFLSVIAYIFTKRANLFFSLLISLSGICYGFSYFPLSPCTDLRYNYWVIGATLISGIVFLDAITANNLKNNKS